MTTATDALPARASTHVWCLVCRDVMPSIDRPLPERSARSRRAFEGATLHCRRCDTAHVTIYVPTSHETAVADSGARPS